MKQQRSLKQLPMKQQLSPSSKTKKVDEEHRLIRLYKELYKDDKSSFISVTELLRLTNIGIPSADVTWSRTKMSVEHCICVRHTCVRTRPTYNPQHTHRSEPTDSQPNGRAKFFLNDEELNLSSSYDSNKKDSYDKYSNGRNSLSSEDSKCSTSKFKKNSFNSKLKLTNEKASFFLGNNLSVYKSDINLDNHLSPNLFGKQGRRQLTKSNSFNNIINSYQNGTYRSNAETMNHYPNNEHSIGHNSLDLPDIRLRQQHYFTSVLSLINPYDARISKFEVDYVKIAELNPIRTFIAVATNYTVHTISIGLCKVIATCHLPEMVDHICWLTPLIVAIVTSRTVYHWNLKNNTNQPVVVFFKSPKMYNCQIIGYEADDTMAWFAVSSLYLEEDQRTITGLVQIHHMNEQAKVNSGNEVDANNNNCFQQCIEAHCVRFARIRFDENNLESTTLIALKKTSSNTMKIYIIELGPLKAQNNCLVNRTEQLRFNDSVNGQSIDFPLHCVICFKLGLIYVISKYGQLIICDLQTGVQLNEQQRISEDIVLSAKLDIDAQSIVLIARNGQVLLVEFDFGSLIKRFARDVKLKKIAKRIERALDSSNDEVTRL